MSSINLREAFPSTTLIIGSDYDLQTPPLDGLHRPIKQIDTIPGIERIIGADSIIVNIRGEMSEIFGTDIPRIQGIRYQFIQQNEDGTLQRLDVIG